MVLWVFGYGSLVWKAGFEYDKRIIGYIKGYRRVFHQASTDHRGTKEYPGRTVTLEPKEGAITWGAVYRISGHDEESLVLSYLDLREREYDIRTYLDFFTVSGQSHPIPSSPVWATTSSPHWLICGIRHLQNLLEVHWIIISS
jgi:cation transport regulator ChaC